MTISEVRKEKSIAELGKLARGLEIPRHQRPPQAGFDLQDPPGPERKRRPYLRRRRIGNPAWTAMASWRSEPDYNYLPGPDEVYVSPRQIRKFDL